MTNFYIHVIVPLALRGVFTYRVPEEFIEEMVVGKRVVVPFGPKRFYSALVYKVEVQPRQGQKLRDIEYVLDNEPIVTVSQLTLWEWIASYYMCGLGSVMYTALPGAMRLSSQTTVVLDKSDFELDGLSDIDQMLIANLNDEKPTPIKDLENLHSKKAIQKSLYHLIRLGIVRMNEQMEVAMKPKSITFLELSEKFESESSVSELMNSLSNAPKQLELMMTFLELSDFFNGTNTKVKEKVLLQKANTSASILKSLQSKGVFVEIEETEAHPSDIKINQPSKLTSEQLKSLDSIRNIWQSKSVSLLHGITGSGKTLIYAELIKSLSSKDQVLFLVPEIALTSQLVSRLEKLLGFEVLVYHSRFSNKDRLTKWMQMLSNAKPRVIVGARSSVFLPFVNLKLVVVDEEHELSYKQQDSSPFYNAKDSAIWLASKFKAKVLLGSATPSFQSYYLAKTGKYGLVELNERFGQIRLPKISVVDMRKAQTEKKMKADFSEETFAQIKRTISEKQQVIIFQNRRGFAPFQLCESCGWSAECINCDVNLTFHKHFEKLLCHYCGYNIKLPTKCPECASGKLKIKGFGTEKIEDDLEVLLPDARIARMDLDTTRKKMALQNLIEAFSDGAYDILVGTQMVTKGLDFDNVGLVVVMNADSLWNRADFRSFEKSYQLLTQVSGRAGRKKKQGTVLIQTYNPDHPIIAQVRSGNFRGLYESQILEREQFLYPPFSRLIRIQLSHQDAAFNREAANFMGNELRSIFGDRLLGPEEPSIARVRNRFLRQMFIKIETKNSIQKSKQAIWQVFDLMEAHQDYRKIRLSIDVDPI
ncbi:primosomal protein N' [Salibacteraceae bacterium]|nr:primosomal protein N' [Salibacteraceae bacterium]